MLEFKGLLDDAFVGHHCGMIDPTKMRGSQAYLIIARFLDAACDRPTIGPAFSRAVKDLDLKYKPTGGFVWGGDYSAETYQELMRRTRYFLADELLKERQRMGF